ncbi:trigger factor [Raoultibacter timonensis]|uniref:Trigger factor n=1 Tax=Raoultibacter timonensis TaxID=1907662 RepID=A0ABM7WKN9_9ACTN|nr:trigger factor [Raoultibacter timonensis]BDE96923.1 trigger factor [Raoultibacter timonensis]BDF51526.1 trigger factor [Raoultibacter timonensis]
MKVTEKKLDDGRIQLEAVATPEEVEQALNAAEYGFAQQMNLRPVQGKSIEQIVEDQLGIKDLASIVEPQATEMLVPFAIDKKNIIPSYPPKATAKSPLKRGQSFTFGLTVSPRPDYELSSYDPVSITVAPFEIDPAEVENEIARMADQFAEFVTDDPHPVQSGDHCMLAIEATKDGEVMQGLTTDGRTYTAGAGLMPDGFDENVIGMDVGETKSFTFTGPGLDDKGNQIDETIECTVTVKEIQKRVIPAITDEWVKKNMPLYRDAAALRGSIKERIEKGRMNEYENYKRQVAASELAKRFTGRIADEVYEAMQQTMLMNMRGELQQQGMTFEQFVEQNGGEQQFNMMLMMQIRETLVQGYALDALFRHEGLVVTDEDLEDACRLMNPQNPQMARQQMESSGRGFALREIAERMKANKWLLEHAEVTVAEPQK